MTLELKLNIPYSKETRTLKKQNKKNKNRFAEFNWTHSSGFKNAFNIYLGIINLVRTQNYLQN